MGNQELSELLYQLKLIAEKLDESKKLHEGGFPDAHIAANSARVRLHYVIKNLAAQS